MREHLNRRSFLAGSMVILGANGLHRTFAAERSDKVGAIIVGGLPQATDAGLAVLRQGGNAVDAAVTAALVSGVVGVYSCGIGGYGGAMTIAAPGKNPTCVDFNTVAPAAARANLFEPNKEGQVSRPSQSVRLAGLRSSRHTRRYAICSRPIRHL